MLMFGNKKENSGHKQLLNWKYDLRKILLYALIAFVCLTGTLYIIWYNTGIDKHTEENRNEAERLIKQWGEYNALVYMNMQDGSGVALSNSDGECYMESVSESTNEQQVIAFLKNGNTISLVNGFEVVKGCSPLEIQKRAVTYADSISRRKIAKISGYGLSGTDKNRYGYVASIYGAANILKFFKEGCGVQNSDYILEIYGINVRANSELRLTIYSGIVQGTSSGYELNMYGVDGYLSAQLELIVEGKAYIIYSSSTVGLCTERLDMGTEIYRVSQSSVFSDEDSMHIAMDFIGRVQKVVGSASEDVDSE